MTDSRQSTGLSKRIGCGLEGLFWQSIMNSENAADFEAYLAQFPNGVFRALAENRLTELRSSADNPRGAAGGGSRHPRIAGPRFAEC